MRRTLKSSCKLKNCSFINFILLWRIYHSSIWKWPSTNKQNITLKMISKVLISKYKRKPKQSHYSFRTFCFFDSTLYFSYVSSSFLLISISTLLLHKCSFARSIFPDFIIVDNSADASLIAFSVTTIPLFKISLSAVYFTSLSCSLCLEEDSFFLSLNSS